MRKTGYRAIQPLPPGSSSADLQNVIDQAVSAGDNSVDIQISDDMIFTATVTIPQSIEVMIYSDAGNNWVMSQTNAAMRHFEVNGSIILENIILDGGNSGGGMQLNRGAIALEDGAVIRNCQAVNGGAVQIVTGVFSIYGGTIENNNAEKGGGIYMSMGTFNMSSSTGLIRANTASESGGGIYIEGSYNLFLSGGEICDNNAVTGGGMYINNGTFEMSRGIFSGNYASSNGGGIYVKSSAGLEISGSNSKVTGNSAPNGNGGGIYTENTTYANISTDSNVIFLCNTSSVAHNPPDASLYPNIECASATLANHPLNNFDINNTDGEVIPPFYHISYNANGGIGSYAGPDISPCTIDTVMKIVDTGISFEGHSFASWNTRADGAGISYQEDDTIDVTTDNLVLYAQWDVNLYTVIYGANGGKGGYADTAVPHASQYQVLSTSQTQITRDGHSSTEWNSEPDKTGISYQPGDVITLTGDLFLYAQWIADLCSVTYNANGGSGAHTDSGIVYGTQYHVLSANQAQISRAGCSCARWNTAPDGSGNSYAEGDVIILVDNIILYAQWDNTLYTINYNANGGSGIYADGNISYGAEYQVLPVTKTQITRLGYNFVSWNTEQDGSGYSYVPGTEITITDDVDLYAQWMPKLYTVTYRANNGSGGHVDANIPYGGQYVILTAPNAQISRSGYIFTGWNTLPDGSGAAYSPGTGIVITSNVVLYAQWTPGLHKVTYEANLGTGTYTDNNIVHESQYQVLTVSETQISRTGYTFIGWNSAPNGSGLAYAPGDTIIVIDDVLLYAQWTPLLYTVTYNANCGCGGHIDINIPYGAVYRILTPQEANIWRNGYIFIGWNTHYGGKGACYTPGGLINITGNVILYAQWKLHTGSCCDPCKKSCYRGKKMNNPEKAEGLNFEK